MAAKGLLALEVTTLQGDTVPVRIQREEHVRTLKAQVAPLLPGTPAAAHLRLFLAGQELTDKRCLGEQVKADSKLTVVIDPGVPEWARKLGFTSDHPNWLRAHFASYGLEVPEWLTDDAVIWKKLEDQYTNLADQMAKLSLADQYANQMAKLSLGGQPCTREDKRLGQVYAKPSESIQVAPHGRISNKKDSCIQQCGLAKGPLSEGADPILAEVYNDVPSRPTEVKSLEAVTADTASSHSEPRCSQQ